MTSVNIKEAIEAVVNDVQKLEVIMDHYGVIEKEGNKRLCPFHSDHYPSMAIDKKKAKFKCFTHDCKAYGDAIDFVQRIENMDKIEAVKKAIDILGLGLTIEKDELDELDEKLRYNNKAWYHDNSYLLEDIYYYKDINNEPLLAKLKFRNPATNKKQFMQFVIKRDQQNKLFADYKDKNKPNLLYNMKGIEYAKEHDYYIFIVEGEKDADNLRSIGLTATTCNTINMATHEVFDPIKGCSVVVLRDNDKTGFEYEEKIRRMIKPKASQYRVPLIREIHSLKSENKGDISDFIEFKREQGFNNRQIKDEILNRVRRSLNLKDKYELQQDWKGVYKTVFKYDKEGEIIDQSDIYLTDFNVSHIDILEQKDSGDQEIELHLITEHGSKRTVRGRVNDLFLDAKTFAKHCKMDFSYKPTAAKYFIDFKQWLNRYFVLEVEEEYSTIGIRKINDEYVYITNDGVMKKDGILHKDFKANGTIAQVKLEGVDKLTVDEARELQKHLFKFNSPTNCYNLIGSLGAHLLNGIYRGCKGKNVHILCMFGESGAGKSFSLSNIAIPLLGLNTSALGFSGLTQYTISRNVSTSYLPVIIDEVKPSKAPQHKMQVLSNLMRNITEDYVDFRGTKDQKVNNFHYLSSLIIAGEEGIEETAAKNRSNTVWFHVKDLTPEAMEHGMYFITEAGEKALRSLSKMVNIEILNNWNPERLNSELKDIEDKYVICHELDPRVRRTFCNTMLGYKLIKELLSSITGTTEGMKDDFEVSTLVYDNIFENVLEEAVRVRQDYEDLFEVISELASRDSDFEKFALIEGIHYKLEKDKLMIHISSTFDLLDQYYRSKGKQNPMSAKAFIKQSCQSEYICSDKKNEYYKTVRFGSKSKKCYIYDVNKLSSLNMEYLAPKFEDTLEKVEEGQNKSWDEVVTAAQQEFK